jgi:hypothetical protein
MPHIENDRIVESTNEARAGVTGQNVNYVLLISTLAVIVLLAGAYLVMSSTSPRPPEELAALVRGCLLTAALFNSRSPLRSQLILVP